MILGSSSQELTTKQFSVGIRLQNVVHQIYLHKLVLPSMITKHLQWEWRILIRTPVANGQHSYFRETSGSGGVGERKVGYFTLFTSAGQLLL